MLFALAMVSASPFPRSSLSSRSWNIRWLDIISLIMSAMP
jgi:hypothetical protein